MTGDEQFLADEAQGLQHDAQLQQQVDMLVAQVRQLESDRETVIAKHNIASKRIIAAMEWLAPRTQSVNPSLFAIRKAVAILQGREQA